MTLYKANAKHVSRTPDKGLQATVSKKALMELNNRLFREGKISQWAFDLARENIIKLKY